MNTISTLILLASFSDQNQVKEHHYNNSRSTRSTITLSTPEGYETIYCHWDGHPSSNGKILLDHYDTEDKVKELIALGSLSTLNKKIAPEEGDKHSFCHPAKNVTVAYYRDRGEGTYPSIMHYDQLIQLQANREDFNYVFEDGEWWLLDSEGGTFCLKPFNTIN